MATDNKQVLLVLNNFDKMHGGAPELINIQNFTI